jgi:hypothetical protein
LFFFLPSKQNYKPFFLIESTRVLHPPSIPSPAGSRRRIRCRSPPAC